MMSWKLIITAFVAVALSQITLVSSQGIDYNTLQSMGIDCQSRHSCAAMTSSKFDDRNCECDSQCRNFDDCCIDAGRRRGSAQSDLTCLQHGVEYKGTYVLGKCKTGWSGDDAVRQNCEGSSGNLRDPYLSAPLTDTGRSLTYKNRYCAVCNEAKFSDLSTWAISLTCNDSGNSIFNATGDITMRDIEDNLVYSESAKSWGINRGSGSSSGSTFFPCRLLFDATDRLERFVRYCRPNLTSTCDKRWRRQNIRRLCSSYTAVVYTDEAIYKNPHCALCNNVNLSAMKCTNVAHKKTLRPMSFTMLVDVNIGDGNRVGMVSDSRCPEGQKWDKYFKKCRSLVCGIPGFSVVDGKCVQS